MQEIFCQGKRTEKGDDGTQLGVGSRGMWRFPSIDGVSAPNRIFQMQVRYSPEV